MTLQLSVAVRVAPHAGAWIETCSAFEMPDWSPVAPHAGAWIETAMATPPLRRCRVAPHAGAWIETM